VENLKNARELVLREYEDLDPASLPDERYSIKLKYYDNAQLLEERKSFDVQAKSFEVEVQHLYDVMETVYDATKARWGGLLPKNVIDFHDLAGKLRGGMRRRISRSQHVDTKDYAYRGRPDWSDQPNYYEAFNKAWDEISFVKPADTEVERLNRTYVYEKDKVKRKLIIIRNRLQDMYEYRYPIERRVMEERLQFLEQTFAQFDYMINPYHVQPGLPLRSRCPAGCAAGHRCPSGPPLCPWMRRASPAPRRTTGRCPRGPSSAGGRTTRMPRPGTPWTRRAGTR
jgi:hypothetical protein